MTLVDTSVWIDYFRGTRTPETEILSDALAKDEDLCISGIILTEILQGILQEKEYQMTKSMLNDLIFLPMSKEAHILAADIYRRAKQNGSTIRNTIDCLIAACAITHDALLLHNDRDYLAISRFSKLKLASK